MDSERLKDERAGEAAADPDRLLPGEDPSTPYPDEAQKWVEVYDELLLGGSDGAPKLYKMHRETKRVIGDDANKVREFEPLPGVPKYAGVKLFLPLFPFLAVLAAWGLETVAAFVTSRISRASDLTSLAGPIAIAAAILPAAFSLARIHPYELSYYNAFVGGLPGAVRAGFESQYYDLIYVKMTDWFNANLPANARITFLPNNKEYVRNSPWLVWTGRLRPDVRFVNLESADFLVLTHEARWPDYAGLSRSYAKRPVLWQLTVERVPLVTVYRLATD